MKKRIYALILAVSFVFCCMVLPVSAERVPTLTIESKKVKIGGEVEVALSIDGNPGIAGIAAELKYDKTVMTLVSMNANADFGGTFVGDASRGNGFSWVSAADIKTDGVFATFKFRINDDATPGKYGIELEIGDGNTSNSAGEDVKFSVVNGSLSVIKFIPGDINDDERVNVKDLVAFAQYLAKWDVKVNELALDVNCDGKVNVKDIVRLAQYLAGWDVSIGELEWNGMTKLKGYESIDFGGRTFTIASRNDGAGYNTTPEVWVETITNDSYNDSVFERNKLMNELYNCTIEVDENGENGYAADFASGGGKYVASTMQYATPFTQPGYYNILSLDIDFTKSWWDQNYINDLSYDGKLYSIVGDFARKAMECTWVITFNKTVYENSGIQDDIYQLVRDKKWTMDKMLEMSQKALRDVNNDQKYDIGSAEDSDIIGFTSSEFSYRAFFFGCGERYVTKNESGKFVNALNLGKGSEVVDKIITLANDYSYQTAGYEAYQKAFKANKVLFMGEVLNVISYLSDTEGLEFGVVPFPLYDENQSRYYVHVNNHLPAYGMPTSFADTQILSDFWTLYAAHSKYTVREAFVNSCKYVWTSDEENSEMVDIILDSRIYDPGYNWNFADSFEGYLNTMVESGRNQYTTIVERASCTIDGKISEYEQRLIGLVEAESIGVMTYDQYVEAEVDSKVVIEAYIQAKQVYSEQYGDTTLYLQDADGAYFVYRLACTAEDYATYTIGKKVKISGVKAVWSGEVEITDATIELLDGYYVAEAKDATGLLANEEELIKLQNQLVSFKGLTVAASKDADDKEVAYLYKWNGTGAEGDDLYFNVTLDGKTYQFLVESDLCGADTDVYKTVKSLKIGDKIDVEGFLYWYNGVNPHITSVQIVK